MSAISPKTIVITTYPGKCDGTAMSTQARHDISILDIESYDVGLGCPKKRRRLTHLSPDEKLLRRKLKNRVAAQTARDRKKAQMSELEEKVAELEAENKLLKQENASLKDMSLDLRQENCQLKSRLGHPATATPIKTESDTFNTCCSSAEGTGSDFVSVGGPLFPLGGSSQSDDLLGLLHEIAESDECKQEEKAGTPSTAVIARGRGGANTRSLSTRGQAAGGASSHSPVVGLSSAELESLNELIQIDHIYVKSQPQTTHQNSAGSTSSTTAPAAAQITIKSPVVVGSKRTHSGAAVLATQQQQQTSLCNIKPTVGSFVSATNTLSSNKTVVASNKTVVAAEPEATTPVPHITDDDTDMPLDVLNSISETDVDASLDFFQKLVDDLLENDASFKSDINRINSMSLPHDIEIPAGNAENKICVDSIPSYMDHESSKLLPITCDQFSDQNSPSSFDSGFHSDSGISSDTEALSPHGSDTSMVDDYSWQDSFIDLFPDLQ